MIPGLLGALSGGFDPLDVAGCVLALDISYPNTLLDAEGNPADINEEIRRINDIRGGSMYFATTSGPARSETVNGHYAVKFTGQYLQANTSPAITAVSWFLVIQNRTGEDILGSVFEETAFADQWLRYLTGNGYLGLFRTSRINNYPLSVPATGAHLINGVSSGDNYEVWIDGASKGAQTPSFANGENWVIGGMSNVFSGLFASLYVWDSVLTAVNRQQLVASFGAKWGITLDQSPVNTVAPALSAAGWTVGQVASCDTGTWTNEPTSYAYQWQRKDGGYTDIPGATSSSYLLAAADAGKNVRCGVTPSNAFATGTVAYSLDSDLIL